MRAATVARHAQRCREDANAARIGRHCMTVALGEATVLEGGRIDRRIELSIGIRFEGEGMYAWPEAKEHKWKSEKAKLSYFIADCAWRRRNLSVGPLIVSYGWQE
jgi:hypothetical protein